MPQVLIAVGAQVIAGYFAVAGTLAYAFVYVASAYVLASAEESLFNSKPRKGGRSLDVAISDSGQGGFAIYGEVRVGGTSVIPC